MPKILAQTGMSLADIYNIEGSIAGVANLESNDVHLVHEMGAAIMSERLVGTIVRGTTGDIAQNIGFDVTIAEQVMGNFYRILGVQLLTDDGTRVDRAQISIATVAGRELPLYAWDDVLGDTLNIRIQENGQAVANMAALVNPSIQQTMPSLGVAVSTRADERVGNTIMFRGLTNGFGAGTVEVIALVYVASLFTPPTRLFASVGLPLPGW